MAKKRKPRTGLSKAEEAFCRAYVMNGGNGAAAVSTAWSNTRGWKPQTRSEKASKLLSLDKIATRVAELTKIMREKANAEFAMSAEEVIWRLTMMARANLHHYLQLDEGGQPTIAFRDADEGKLYPLGEVTVVDIVSGPRQGKRTKAKLCDRIAALKLLGQQLGLFAENVKLTATAPIPVALSSAESQL